MKKIFAVLFTIVAVVSIAQFNGDKQRTSYHSAPCECVLPYKVYTANLNQTGTGNPVATVLQNTIGNVVWTTQGTCDFYGTLNGAFTEGKTFIIFQNGINVQVSPFDMNSSEDFVRIHNDGCEYELGMQNRSIEIRVYP